MSEMTHAAATDHDSRGARARSRRVLEDLFGPVEERGFTVRYWDGDEEAPPSERASDFVLVLRHPGALRQAFLPPTDRSMALAFGRGHVDVDGDLEAAARLADAVKAAVSDPVRVAKLASRLARLPRGGGGQREGGSAPDGRQRGALHSRSRDRASVQHHYDMGNDFFRLYLDSQMVYSCAYFEEGSESIDAAQEAKLDLICRKLRLEPGDRFLDIGCGWGSLVDFAATRYGVQATGLTLSTRQAELARTRIRDAGIQDRCRIEVCDYRDLDPPERFDKIASVGMVEHVGRPQLRTYFRAADGLLEPGGLFLNHGIVDIRRRPGWLAQRARRRLARYASFMQRFIFPDSELVSPAELTDPGECVGLELRDVESLREHYALTLRAWLRRLEARQDEAVAQVGGETYRLWRLYLAVSASLFATGKLGVVQMLWGKPDADGHLPLPRTRADLYVSAIRGAS